MPGIRDLKDKVSVVTGAGSGIGRATALALAAEGAKLVVTDVNGARARAVADEITAKGGSACVREVDVAQKEQVKELAQFVVSEYGHVDIVHNNAGVGLIGRSMDATIEDWEWIVGINFWGVIYGAHYFLPYMVERRFGHMVNTASMAGLTVTPGLAAYSATKFGVVGLSESLRTEMREYNVGVTVVCPGFIRTAIGKDGRYHVREEDGASAEDMIAVMEKHGRPPEQVARGVIRGIRKDIPIVPIGIEAWLGWWSMRLSVRLTERLMIFIMNKAAGR